MPFSLVPTRVFERYECITPALLRKMGVRLVISDLDYTLAPKSVRDPDAALRAWIDALAAEGIRLTILSNNRSSTRVEQFCAALGVDYVGHAGKPSTRGYRDAMTRAGVTAEETVMLGDKLLTDVLGANRCGVRSLMVEPRGGPVGAWNHVLHLLQRPFKRISRRRSK